MQSKSSRILPDIYSGRILTVVAVVAAVLSLSLSFVRYGGKENVSIWLSVSALSLAVILFCTLSVYFVRGRGVLTVVSSVAVILVATIVFGCLIPENGTILERIGKGILVCTGPYMVSWMVTLVVYRIFRLCRHGDSALRRRYTSKRMDFLSGRGKVELSINFDRFLYAETAESNYLTVAYLGGNSADGVIFRKIRSSLKIAERRFDGLPIVKVNRSCIANGERIDYVVKDGRNGMLKLRDCDVMLKISQYNYDTFAKYERFH